MLYLTRLSICLGERIVQSGTHLNNDSTNEYVVFRSRGAHVSATTRPSESHANIRALLHLAASIKRLRWATPSSDGMAFISPWVIWMSQGCERLQASKTVLRQYLATGFEKNLYKISPQCESDRALQAYRRI